MEEIADYQQLCMIVNPYSAKDWVYDTLANLCFPLLHVTVPVIVGDGRQRELNRKERMEWLKERDVLPTTEARKLLLSFLHIYGHFFFDDFTIALEFQLRFA